MILETITPGNFDSVTILAGEAAVKELEAGRRSVILMTDSLACAAFDMGNPSKGIYIRFDGSYSALESLEVDTLILVRPNELENAEYAADHLLGASKDPKIINIGG